MSPLIWKSALFATALLAFNCRNTDSSDARDDERTDQGQRDEGRDISAPSPSDNLAQGANSQGAPAGGIPRDEQDRMAETGSTSSAERASATPSPSQEPSEKLGDPEIAQVTEAVNSAEIDQAQLARQKSKNAKVRAFAAMMIEHHGEAKRKQADLKMSTAPSTFSRNLSEESNTTLQTLRNASSADFDRTYLQAQVDGHQKVLDALDRDLIPQAQDNRLKGYLAELKPTVERHLEQAKADLKALSTPTQTRGASDTRPAP